jgi:hypothetical protein
MINHKDKITIKEDYIEEISLDYGIPEECLRDIVFVSEQWMSANFIMIAVNGDIVTLEEYQVDLYVEEDNLLGDVLDKALKEGKEFYNWMND